jgi:hypothetical protein
MSRACGSYNYRCAPKDYSRPNAKCSHPVISQCRLSSRPVSIFSFSSHFLSLCIIRIVFYISFPLSHVTIPLRIPIVRHVARSFCLSLPKPHLACLHSVISSWAPLSTRVLIVGVLPRGHFPEWQRQYTANTEVRPKQTPNSPKPIPRNCPQGLMRPERTLLQNVYW